MNCPHGKTEEQECHARGCTQNVFEPLRGGSVVAVVRMDCDTCGRGVGVRRLKRRVEIEIGSLVGRRGMSARTIRNFQTIHAGHEVYWKLISVDTGGEVCGRGLVPVRLDSDDKNDSLIKTDS